VDYKSLKDVYSDETLGRAVPPLPRQSVTPTPEQDARTQQTVLPFALNQVYEMAWPIQIKGVPFSIKQFDAHAGEGNGERRVAALFYPQQKTETEKNYTRRLGSFIGGQRDSYDVTTPYGKFEVKEFKLSLKTGQYRGSVRVGAEGKHTTSNILSQIKNILILILQNYAAMDEDSKKVLNTNLIDVIKTENSVPKDWTLEKYIDAIFDVSFGDEKGIQEFSKSLFNASIIDPEDFKRNPKRHAYFVYTIPQILQGLKQLALKDENQANLDSEITRVQNLQSTLKNLYLKKDDEEFSKEIEREAEVLDRKLVSKACASDRGANCITLNTFLQKIEKANLAATFANIDQLRNSEVGNLFPPEVKGFFAVFETKFKYIPRNEFIKHLYIASFTQKGLKIALRREAV